MASGALLGSGDGGGDGGSRDMHRWGGEGKVYTRKTINKSSKSSSTNPAPTSASGAPLKPLPPLPATSEASSSLNRPTVQLEPLRTHQQANGHGRSVTISVASRSHQELRDIRRKLAGELEQVRAFSKRFEGHGVALAGAPTPTGYALSQFSATDPNTPVGGKRMNEAPTPTGGPGVQRRQLSVNVVANEAMEGVEKEKRTPKANQYYRNSEFLLAKDKFPPDSHGSKKSKTNGGSVSAAEKKLYAQAFKSCSSLLSKLMKHKHGWVFNQPVDVKALGLHDYYIIIKYPMDLGTVKSRLDKNWYKSPREFAEDVRLTFRNAMTYNPKGQDVHVMAEQLLQIFEERWPAIEDEFAYVSQPPVTKKPPPPPLDLRALERSDSTVHTMAVEPKTKAVSQPTNVARTPAPKKPKAKDLNKRDMTFEEKQKLSNNLQNLPPEKLETIVQIIKRRNLSLSQHDDEIEVDIDSVDVETLWELDRFVMNYKKSLSKNKRRAELAMLARQKAEKVAQEMIQERAAAEVTEKVTTASSTPFVGEKKTDNASGSSSSSSSSSDSGSSSSDSDSDSSSGYGSDAAQSPRK